MPRHVKRDCPMCGRTFRRRQSEIAKQDRKGGHSFCSLNCSGRWVWTSPEERARRLALLAEQNALLYGTNDPELRSGPNRPAGGLNLKEDE